MRNNELSPKHCHFLIRYHLIWCPKFQHNILTEEVETDLKGIFYRISDKYGYEIEKLEIKDEYIHLLVSTQPTVAATDVVRTLKSFSTVELFKSNEKWKKFYGRYGSLWNKGYFASTNEEIDEITIQKYILDLKKD